MKKKRKERVRTIGMSLELAAIIGALNGMRVLMEGNGLWRPETLAIHGLVVARLELIRAVIRGDVDPGIAWAFHSATVPEEEARPTDDPELRLEEWP